MDVLAQDVRFALRSFRRRPLVVGGALLSLAIGIAANTAVFAMVNGVLLRPVPGVTRPERLVEISRSGETTDVSYPMYLHLRAQSAVLDELAAYSQEAVSVAVGEGDAVARGALVVSESYFSLLGVRPAIGRVFGPEESHGAAAPVAVITHELWQRELAAASDPIGRTVRLNGSPVRVIGVLPPGFAGHHTGLLTDVFLPFGLRIPGFPDPASLAGAGSSVQLIGRLRPGAGTADASRTLGAIADEFGRTRGESSESSPYALAVAEWGPLPAWLRTGVGGFLSVLFVLVGLALTMACINVSTILLAQASERQRELAVRRALGASRRRLVRQIITEVGVLFVAAGVLGVVVAAWSTGQVAGLRSPVPLPGRIGADLGVDLRVVAFSLVLTLGTALAFSLVPALRTSRFALVPALREGGATDPGGRTRLRGVLVGAQVAMTAVLLSATLLFGRALLALRSLDPGWNGDGVAVLPIDLEQNGTSPDAGAVAQRELLERLSGLPEIEVASLATKLPLGGRSTFGPVTAPGLAPSEGAGFPATLNRVSRGYLRTMRIPLLRGRDIAPTDDARSDRVAVVNATMARRLWPNAEPVGQTFFVGEGEGRAEIRVIGVAGDAEQRVPGEPPRNFYYVPAAQWYNAAVVLHVRARPGMEQLATNALHSTVGEAMPSLPVGEAKLLTEALETFLLPQRLATWVSGAMGTFGLLLALVGVYGLTAFLVSRRSREMAIRLALGATPGGIVRHLLVEGLRAPAIGLAIGMAFAAGLTVGASRFIDGARAGDPLVLAGVPLILAAATALAIVSPLRQILGVSPMHRLRGE